MFRKNLGYAVGVATFVASLVLVTPLAQACSVCGCGDPLVTAGDARPLSGGVRFALESDYLTAQARSDDDPSLTESVAQYTIRPVLVYSPTDALSLVAQVPLVQKNWSLSGPDAATEGLNHFGLGDVDLGARWFLWQRTDLKRLRRENFAVTAGTSFPTGPNDSQVNGQRIDDHAQLGTGSFGPYAGVLYAFHQDPWNLFTSVSFRTRTTNAFGYRYGDAALFSIQGTFRPFERLAFVLGLDGRYAARDTSHGDLQANTGGLVLAAVPGVSVNLFDTLWLRFRTQIPFFTHLFGVQQVGPVFSLSLQYSFG